MHLTPFNVLAAPREGVRRLGFYDPAIFLSEVLGITTEEFERKVKGMTLLNLVRAD